MEGDSRANASVCKNAVKRRMNTTLSEKYIRNECILVVHVKRERSMKDSHGDYMMYTLTSMMHFLRIFLFS